MIDDLFVGVPPAPPDLAIFCLDGTLPEGPTDPASPLSGPVPGPGWSSRLAVLANDKAQRC